MFSEIEEIEDLRITEFVSKYENLKNAPRIVSRTARFGLYMSSGMEYHLNINMSYLSFAHGPKISRNRTERRLTDRQRH